MVDIKYGQSWYYMILPGFLFGIFAVGNLTNNSLQGEYIIHGDRTYNVPIKNWYGGDTTGS